MRVAVTDEILELIKGAFVGVEVSHVNVYRIVIDGNDVNIELYLKVQDGWDIEGTLQLGLDDTNKVSEAIKAEVEKAASKYDWFHLDPHAPQTYNVTQLNSKLRQHGVRLVQGAEDGRAGEGALALRVVKYPAEEE